MKRHIAEGLKEYLNQDYYPWHMPGHKRKKISEASSVDCPDDDLRKIDRILDDVSTMDVTEVAGTDDLHHPEAMIKRSLDDMAKTYGVCSSYYLVNGSTCGILASVAACMRKKKGYIIIAENCHKSVYNAVELLGLTPIYVRPEWSKINNEKCMLPDMEGAVDSDSVEDICRTYDNIGAMVITSPTYEGVVSDVYRLSGILKKYDIKLIVDEAHGAHLPFMPGTPESAVYCGADVVVQSLHKTLPAVTQTAVLHVTDDVLDRDIKKYLSVFMSSSPSYLLLCSMERAVAWACENDYSIYLKSLEKFRKRAKSFKNIVIVGKEDAVNAGAFDYDNTRIVVTTRFNKSSIQNQGQAEGYISGSYIEKSLQDIGGIVCEMSGIDYVVLISTAMDEEKDFEQLYDALDTLDRKIKDAVHTVGKADENFYVTVDEIRGLIGKRAVDNLYVYPPGSYIVSAGEEITAAAADKLIEYIRAGKKIRGRLS